MAKRFRTLLIAVVVAVAFVSAMASGQQDTRARITAASSVLLGPPGPATTQATIVSALAELLDVVVSLSARLQHGLEIAQRIGVAKDLLQKTSLFNEKALQYLSLAHRLLTGGQKYERPKELDQFVTMDEAMEKGRGYGRRLVSDALTALAGGRASEAATLLLQLVLGVITPVSGAPADHSRPFSPCRERG